MQIIQGTRGTGKTTELIGQCANDPNGLLVVSDIRQVYYAQHLARSMGLQIREPITFQQVLDKRGLRGIRANLYIDSVDMFLQQIVGRMSIVAISMTGEDTSKD